MKLFQKESFYGSKKYFSIQDFILTNCKMFEKLGILKFEKRSIRYLAN